MHGLEPQAQRDFTGFEHSAHGHQERLSAVIALVDTRPDGLTLQLADAIDAAAVRANRALRSHPGLQVSKSRLLIVEMFGVQNSV
jgi:hypothetical protein